MIGQRAGALLVGDAKQRSALYAFLRDKLLVDPGCVVGGAVRVAACSTRGRRRAVRLECERDLSQWRRRFEVGALDEDVGSRAQQLQALLAGIKNTTVVHIKDLSLGELEHAATPGTALSVDGAVRARVRFASQQSVDSDACRAELASRCCQQLLAVRAMLASGRAVESSDLLLAVCPTLLAMPLPEDFRLQTCACLLIAANSPTD
jgi:hypothetical protein